LPVIELHKHFRAIAVERLCGGINATAQSVAVGDDGASSARRASGLTHEKFLSRSRAVKCF
jgi:hypothetical protein